MTSLGLSIRTIEELEKMLDMRLIKKKPKKNEEINIPYLTKEIIYNTIDDIIKRIPDYCIFNIKNTISLKDNIKILYKDKTYVGHISDYLEIKKFNKHIISPSKKLFKNYYKPYDQKSTLNNKSILLIRKGGIGDLINIQPILKYIKEKYENVKITFGTDVYNFQILLYFPEYTIDNIEIVPIDLEKFNEYDYQIFFVGSIERYAKSTEEHMIDIFSRLSIGEILDHQKYKPELVPDPIITRQVAKLIKTTNNILISPSSSSILRSLPKDKIIELIDVLLTKNYNVYISDTKDKYDNYNNIIKSNFNKFSHKIFNLCKNIPTIGHLVSLVYLADKVISVDTGTAHIACALNKPLNIIYSTIPSGLRLPKNSNNIKEIVPKNFNECGKYPCNIHKIITNCPYIKLNMPVGCLSSINLKEEIEL